MDAEAILADLDPEQREAARITSGPLVIHAGAGSGKTRVISHRIAYAAAVGAVDPANVLVVTFTDKAAGEMVARLASLGLRRATARTFHAAALRQLRYFWPSRHGGAPPPDVLDSKIPTIARLVRGLPGGYRFTQAKDLAEEIEWAKSRRLTPTTYPGDADARVPPIPFELFTRLWADYERAKERAGKVDFDDILTQTVELLETDEEAARTVRGHFRWFSVDEYQDTNPLQQRLLELWLGERDDLCVVGDEDQTIYTFTGATSAFLTGFRSRFPGAREVTLARNYRSTPEVIALANRLLAGAGRQKRLVATRPSGPPPTILPCTDAAAELALIVATIRRLLEAGTPPGEIAVLTRTNAQIPPIEAALTRAAIPFRVRGARFYARPEIREAIRLIGRLATDLRGDALVDAIEAALRKELAFEAADDAGGSGDIRGSGGAASRERNEGLRLVLDIAAAMTAAAPATDAAGLVGELTSRARAESEGAGDGVELLTIHRAKGLEWDAVILPELEEGSLPIGQAKLDDELAEERRLLYVALTRARRDLLITWAETRPGRGGAEVRRHPSRFLRDLGHRASAGARQGAGSRPGSGGRPGAARSGGATTSSPSPLLSDLKAWRLERARTDGVPPYVIAHDATLEAIAGDRPRSLLVLGRAKGMGPTRVERYGEEILEVVARHDPRR